MKKLLSIVILGLLLTGCFNKKETALENCADDRYANYSKDSLASVFYDTKNAKIISLFKSLEITKTKHNEASNKHTKYLINNYYFDGKYILVEYDKRALGTDNMNPDELQSYKKAIEEGSLKLSNVTAHWYEEIGYLTKKLNEEKLYSSSKMFKEASFIKKINVNEYFSKYIECEKEHSEAADAFILRWKE